MIDRPDPRRASPSLVGVIYILMRNSIIAARNRVDEAWSGIDVQLKRRHDLIPNLVEAVKGYATHEQRDLREGHPGPQPGDGGAGRRADRARRSRSCRSALGGLRVVAEQYPELRATENFQQLQRQLSELEDEIQASRRIYNSNVQSYNTKIQQFPMSIVANQGGFTDKEFFEIEDAAEREVPEVSFNQCTPAGSSRSSPARSRALLVLGLARVPGHRRLAATASRPASDEDRGRLDRRGLGAAPRTASDGLWRSMRPTTAAQYSGRGHRRPCAQIEPDASSEHRIADRSAGQLRGDRSSSDSRQRIRPSAAVRRGT